MWAATIFVAQYVNGPRNIWSRPNTVKYGLQNSKSDAHILVMGREIKFRRPWPSLNEGAARASVVIFLFRTPHLSISLSTPSSLPRSYPETLALLTLPRSVAHLFKPDPLFSPLYLPRSTLNPETLTPPLPSPDSLLIFFARHPKPRNPILEQP